MADSEPPAPKEGTEGPDHDGWRSRKLWVCVSAGAALFLGACVLLWFGKIPPEVWKNMAEYAVAITVGGYVVGNVGERIATVLRR